MIFVADLGGYIREEAIYESFSVCVHMSRNVVVSFAEGHSDVLDDKKIGGYMIFCSRFGGVLYSSRGYIRAGVILGLLQYLKPNSVPSGRMKIETIIIFLSPRRLV